MNTAIYVAMVIFILVSLRFAVLAPYYASRRIPKWRDPLPLSPEQWSKSRTIFCKTNDSDPNPFHSHGKIKHAAVKWKNIIYVGKQHSACLLTMVDCGLPKEETQQAMTFGCGFVAEDGEFVDRHEAYRIAMEHNQIVQKHGAPGVPVLYSEDLFERKLAQ